MTSRSDFIRCSSVPTAPTSASTRSIRAVWWCSTTDLTQQPRERRKLTTARLMSRQTSLRTLAENTDGFAILNTNNITPGLDRIVADTNSYYLLGYYSTNTKLDGKFRKITVKVKRPNADVRARPGYLAPTEAELASSRVDALMNGAPPGHSTAPKEFARALERLTPTRGNLPVRVQAAAAPSRIWVTTELDPTTLKLPEWQKGGRARVLIEHESGAAPPIEQQITAGTPGNDVQRHASSRRDGGARPLCGSPAAHARSGHGANPDDGRCRRAGLLMR